MGGHTYTERSTVMGRLSGGGGGLNKRCILVKLGKKGLGELGRERCEFDCPPPGAHHQK